MHSKIHHERIKEWRNFFFYDKIENVPRKWGCNHYRKRKHGRQLGKINKKFTKYKRFRNVTPQNLGVLLTTHQPTEFLWISVTRYHTVMFHLSRSIFSQKSGSALEQRRLCPIFVKIWILINGTQQCGIGLPEIHRNSVG